MTKKTNLFLFTGEETYLMREKIASWKKSFEEKYGGDLNISTIDASTVSPAQILAECAVQPFLAEKRLIFVENFSLPKNEKGSEKGKNDPFASFIDGLSHIPDTCVCIFVMPKCDKRTKFYTFLKKSAQIEEFNPLSEAELGLWVRKAIKELHFHITNGACNMLVTNCQGSLWRLSQELKQVVLYMQAESIDTMTEETISAIVTPHFEVDIFRLTDSLGKKDAKTALKVFERLCENGEDVFFIFHMLVRHFRQLILVKNCTNVSQNESELCKTFKIHPFVFKKMLGQVTYFSVDELQKIYHELLSMEIAIKDGTLSVSSSELPSFFALFLEKWIIKYMGQKI